MYNIAGQRFGRLVALRPAHKHLKNGNVAWLCDCDCGNQTIVDGYLLRTGVTKSCGCLRREKMRREYQQNPAFMAQVGNFKNLQDSSHHMKNSLTVGAKNRSGVTGVSFDEQRQVWFARLMLHHHYVLIKAFKRFDDAVAARRQAERKYLGSDSLEKGP